MWVVTLEGREGWYDNTVVGGKASGLYRLIRAGFRVPDGYVVTTQAYRHTMRQTLFGLRTPEQMREAILATEIPVEIERAIRDIHEELFDQQMVAVRSSAVEEDTRQQSYAGQLTSILQVQGVDQVLGAIRSVWASYFNRNHLLYRGRVCLDAPPSYVAVVVQKMLSPRVAGVMFTADPVKGTTDRIVISASAGLGEAVVDGLSEETAYVDPGSGRILQHVPLEPREHRVLKDKDIKLLYRAAIRVNELFSEPQDVEWALDESGLVFLQCRPITTARQHVRTGGNEVWSNVNVGEALPGVATPMTWSIIWSFARRGFEIAFGALGLSVPPDYDLVSSFRGRVYLNLTQFASIASQVPFLSISNLLEVGGGSGTEELERQGFEKRSKTRFLTQLPLTMARMAVSQLATPGRARAWSARLRGRLDDFFHQELSDIGSTELLGVLDEIDRIFDRTGVIMLACGSNFLSSYIVTRELLHRWGGTDAAVKEKHLFSGLRGLASAEPGLQLLDMARYISENPILEETFKQLPSTAILEELEHSVPGGVLRERLQGFLARYGLRAAREAEISTPRWRENPEFLLEVIKRHLESPFLPSGEELALEQEAIRHETTQMIRRYFRTGLGLLFRWILKWTQENARLREELRACVTDTLAMYRHFCLEVGRRLVAAKILADPDDVFFLTRGEVVRYLQQGTGAADMSVIVATRRAAYVAFQEAGDPPDTFVLEVDGAMRKTRQPVPPDAPYLQGLAASPGRRTGRARVVTQLTAQTDVHPGEVLVASFTDVGWTPLFLIVAGVVTDMGGPLSHAAVVAREYGIPAVVNAKEATTLIRTGDLVTVDGNSGRVYLQR